MPELTLVQASSMYECARRCVIRRHRVPCPEFRNYVRAVGSLRTALGMDVQDDYWREVLRRAQWYQYEACAAALPFCHPALRGSEIADELRALLRTCDRTYPAYAQLGAHLVQQLESLAGSSSNPILRKLISLGDPHNGKKAAILVCRAHLIAPQQGELQPYESLKGTEILHTSELRSASFARIIVIGAASWYHHSVFSAPRAQEIDILRFSIVRDRWTPGATLAVGRRGSRPFPSECAVQDDDDFPDDDLVDIEPMGLDVESTLSRMPPNTVERQHLLVSAKLFLLESDKAVCLNADEHSWAMVIDLEKQGPARVRRISIGNIEVGMFILLRTEGGGDYIAPVADRLLGNQAGIAREAQQHWKRQLRRKLDLWGPSRVARELHQRCRVHVDEQDVQRWGSEENIRTRHQEDFFAIMRYIGLEGQAEKYWMLMRAIHKAHTKAGKHIQNLLLEQVGRADLRQLQKHGVMQFELPGEDGGTLTAYRVEAIAPNTIRVSPSYLSRPFDRGEGGGTWLA